MSIKDTLQGSRNHVIYMADFARATVAVLFVFENYELYLDNKFEKKNCVAK